MSVAASPIDLEAPRERPGAGPPEQQGPTLGDGDTAVLDEPGDVDDLFVSCVEGKGVVTRFGSRGSTFIGARRDATVEGGIRYLPEQVVLVHGEDHRRFAREYTRVLAEGSLRIRSREEYLAYRKARDEELRKAKADREAKRKQAAEQQTSTENQNPPDANAPGPQAPAAAPAESTSGG